MKTRLHHRFYNLVAIMTLACLSGCVTQTSEETDRFNTLSDKLDLLVENDRMPGSVTTIIEQGKPVYHYVNGYQDAGKRTAMTDDTLFRLYSMSKPITSVGIMMLQEQGKLRVSDPVSKYLPAFKNMQVYVSGELNNMVTEPVKREMTISDLLAHKSGLTYHFTGDTPVHQYYRKHGVKRDTPVGTLPTDGAPAKNLSELSDRLAAAPLLHQPGEVFDYSYSTTLLGKVIETVSGESLDSWMRENLFTPLGMRNTGFFVTGDDLNRFVTNYLMTDSGLKVIETTENTDYKDADRLLDGGGALAGTASDYVAFATMLANKGTHNGKRFLSEKSIAQMFTPEITIEQFGNETPIEFGYGFAIGSQATRAENFMPDGAYGWAGSGNTIFWVNPETKSLVVFMTQVITPPQFAKEVPFRQYLLEASDPERP